MSRDATPWETWEGHSLKVGKERIRKSPPWGVWGVGRGIPAFDLRLIGCTYYILSALSLRPPHFRSWVSQSSNPLTFLGRGGVIITKRNLLRFSPAVLGSNHIIFSHCCLFCKKYWFWTHLIQNPVWSKVRAGTKIFCWGTLTVFMNEFFSFLCRVSQNVRLCVPMKSNAG